MQKCKDEGSYVSHPCLHVYSTVEVLGAGPVLAKQQHFSFSLTKPAVGLCEGKVTCVVHHTDWCHSGVTNT